MLQGVGLMIFESGMHFDFEKAQVLCCSKNVEKRGDSQSVVSFFFREDRIFHRLSKTQGESRKSLRKQTGCSWTYDLFLKESKRGLLS